ncbi:DUF4446 family protein [Candidatus Daviesbacteria bacterium]|nr:DUF4446 family protein [Candidatus Daviesbacteria bacterium]
MYSDWVIVLSAVFLVWLVILTYQNWKERKLLSELFAKSGERDIRKKFEEILKGVGEARLKSLDLDKKIATLREDSLSYIQKVALLRYNPYEDTGGDISFSLALLDDRGNGLVVTSLHGRAGTRIFAKDVTEGKVGKYNFSKEEERVIKKAMGIK